MYKQLLRLFKLGLLCFACCKATDMFIIYKQLMSILLIKLQNWYFCSEYWFLVLSVGLCTVIKHPNLHKSEKLCLDEILLVLKKWWKNRSSFCNLHKMVQLIWYDLWILVDVKMVRVIYQNIGKFCMYVWEMAKVINIKAVWFPNS